MRMTNESWDTFDIFKSVPWLNYKITHSKVCHDSFMSHDSWEWRMSHGTLWTHSKVCHDSFIRWQIQKCGMTHLWVMTHENEIWHTYEWVMTHIWKSHVTYMNESCHTYKWVMSHIWMSHVTHPTLGCRTSNIHVNDSGHMCDMTHWYVRHDSLIHVTRLIHMR